jgi:hypothetical protein
MSDQRRARAPHLLRVRPNASALDIDTAAVRGEPRARRIPKYGREAIGLGIAMSLVRIGQAVATRDNRFRLALRTHSAM